MVSRQLTFFDQPQVDSLMRAAGGPGTSSDNLVIVSPEALTRSGIRRMGRGGFVHEIGIHGSEEENDGGLQNDNYPLRDIEHQDEYNDAGCELLGLRSGC